MQSMTDQEILTTVTPMVEAMQLGWDENNRDKFIAHDSEQFQQFMTKDEFNAQRGEIFPQLGKHTSLRLIHLHRNPTNITVLWEMSCTGRPTPVLVIYIFAETEQGIVMTAAWPSY